MAACTTSARETDDELGRAAKRVEQSTDDVVARAREHADDTLDDARRNADVKLKVSGASDEVRATAKEEVATARAVVRAERSTADRDLDKERELQRATIRALLDRERGQTDEHLALERTGADDGMVKILAELAEAIRLRDEFLSVASHELRTPLTPLTMRLHVLARETARYPDSPLARQVEQYIATANRQVRRLSALVADLLDVSLIAAGRRTVELEMVDLGALVTDVAALYAPAAERARCALTVEASRVVGYWDHDRLEQTVTHLLENALKFASGSAIRIRLEAIGDRARLTVSDAGIGIAAEHLRRIFGRFERAVSERNYGGLGIGLHICHRNVEAMGGTIGVESVEGHGTTFTIELPIAGPRAPRDGGGSDEGVDSTPPA